MTASRDLETIRRAAKLACKLVAEIGEKNIDRNHNEVGKLLESLLTRARGAPQLLSTWGAAPFLIFYASKAVGADAWTLRYVAQRAACSSSNNCVADTCPRKIDSTELGYALYLAALIAYHCESGIITCMDIVSSLCSFQLLVDRLIEEYLESRKQYRLLYVVEHLSRLITIYAEPILNKTERSGNGKHVIEMCYEIAGGNP